MQESEKGPRHWGELKKEWKACKHGKLQSPIDLLNHRVKVIPKLGDIKMNYKPANATIKNRGHDISIVWLDDAGSIQINGTDYFLQQCHWHSPSEHSINGRRLDLELHIVHSSPDVKIERRIAVIAMLYKFGKPDRFLSKFTKDMVSITDTKQEVHKGVIDPRELKMGGLKYYRYIGSLTIPPCTEGVIWTMNKRISTVSREQVSLLREAVHDHAEMNARPLQPLNERDIHICGPMFQHDDSKN
ncbi:hypothetical protein L484_022574 [Morus notabilis]|uniref:Alpha-carbonic anhydrase domain-containing protein n=2 Tax=Morus notabilis TaxID=981085 RepID=W9R888_9ROSA|nr:hypothetical protein L484_022574 [Morus notabilis]